MENYYLDKWAGEFGDKYTERCNVDPDSRIDIFKKLLFDLDYKFVMRTQVLEVGCNKGHNLEAIEAINIGDEIHETDSQKFDCTGLEPNRALCSQPNIINGNAYDIPWKSNTFDLVFTSGVLIHIPENLLDDAFSEMRRVSNKFIMFIEYYSKEEEGQQYRDFEDKEGVWARPYGEIYETIFPEDQLITTGRIKDLGNDGWGFSDCNYWIYEKA